MPGTESMLLVIHPPLLPVTPRVTAISKQQNTDIGRN